MLVLVKHALPVLDPSKPAREWQLGPEGEAQALRLAGTLRRFLPCRLASSPEPKTMRTAEIVAAELGVPAHPRDGLHEFDRPVLPIMTREEHERVNLEIFARRDEAVLGRESANEALERFDAAMRQELASAGDQNLVVITHGTVLTLFVGKYNRDVDEVALWKQLSCPSLVVLSVPELTLEQVVT